MSTDAAPTPMTDTEYAREIRYHLVRLREWIVKAEKAGITVQVPELVHLYLQSNCASGAPNDWKIMRLL